MQVLDVLASRAAAQIPSTPQTLQLAPASKWLQLRQTHATATATSFTSQLELLINLSLTISLDPDCVPHRLLPLLASLEGAQEDDAAWRVQVRHIAGKVQYRGLVVPAVPCAEYSVQVCMPTARVEHAQNNMCILPELQGLLSLMQSMQR